MIVTERQFYEELGKTPAPPAGALERALRHGRSRAFPYRLLWACAASLLVTAGAWQSWRHFHVKQESASYAQVEEELQEIRDYFNGEDLAQNALYYSSGNNNGF
jgi:hypothetical protein